MSVLNQRLLLTDSIYVEIKKNRNIITVLPELEIVLENLNDEIKSLDGIAKEETEKMKEEIEKIIKQYKGDD